MLWGNAVCTVRSLSDSPSYLIGLGKILRRNVPTMWASRILERATLAGGLPLGGVLQGYSLTRIGVKIPTAYSL